MPHVLLSQHLSLVVVFFGANDAADPKGLWYAPHTHTRAAHQHTHHSARQHVALEEYQANLDAIYEHVSRSSDCCVFVTPPPVDDVARLQYVQSEYDPSATAPERTHALAAAYAQACKAWAAQRNVACFDAHGFMTEKEDWRSFLWDGLHFSARGNKVFFEGLSAFLEQAWGKGLQEFGGLDAPWNAEIDGEGDWEGSISRWYSNGEEEGKTT